jgi:hypothetical protein
MAEKQKNVVAPLPAATHPRYVTILNHLQERQGA